MPFSGLGKGLLAGVLWAPQETAAHATATSTTPASLRIAFPFHSV